MQPYDQARQQHLPGTSQWIVNEKVFITWIANETVSTDIDSAYRNVLWIKGKPGSGKTILATEVLRSLQARRGLTKGKPETTAFHFFSYRYEENRCLRSAWSTLLSQILRQLQDWDEILNQFTFMMVKSEHQYATSTELLSLLHVIALRTTGLVLLLDGVDECEDPESVVSLLTDSIEGTRAKVVILSRPNIQGLLDRLDLVPNIHITKENAQRDLQAYIRHRLEGFQPHHFPPTCSCEQIEAKMLQGANGIFLWVKLMFNYLHLCLGPKHREEAIESLQRQEGMTDMYIRILKFIATKHENDRIIARRIFYWLSFPIRYLSENQLWEVTSCINDLSDPPGIRSDPSPDEGQRDHFHKVVIMACACLVERVGGEYRLVHQSVVEFFWSGFKEPQCQNPIILQFLPTPTQAHNALATECLSYLLSRVPARPLSGDIRERIRPSDLSRHLPFASYAATAWPIHLEKGARFLEESLDESDSLGLRPADTKSLLQLLPTLEKFTYEKHNLNTWVEIQYLVTDNILHLEGIRGWLALVERLSIGDLRLLRKFKDLPYRLQRFLSELLDLNTLWGETLRKHPYQIWGDVTAFFESEFLARTKAVFISSLAPSSLADSTLGSEPLATFSRNSAGLGSHTEGLGCLSIWPSRKFQEASSNMKAVRGLVEPEVCSGWVAQFEIHDTQSFQAVKTHDIRLPLDDKEVLEHVQCSLEYRKTGQTKTAVEKEWSLSFPIHIGPNLDMLVILQSIYFLEICPIPADGNHTATTATFKRISLVETPQQLQGSFTRQSKTPGWNQNRLRVTQSYNYQFSYDGRYLLRENSRCLPGLFRMKTISDSQIFELQVVHIDHQNHRFSAIGKHRPPNTTTTIRSCSFHPTLPLLLFHTTSLGQSQYVYLWDFTYNERASSQLEPWQDQLQGLWSPCPPKSAIERLYFSAQGNEIIISSRHHPNPEVINLQTDAFYNTILSQHLEMHMGNRALIRQRPTQNVDQSVSTTLSLGQLTSAQGFDLDSSQALISGSSSYVLDLNITQSHKTLQMTHRTSGEEQARQDILSFPNNYEFDETINATVTPSRSASDTAKIVLNQDVRPFYDLRKTEQSLTKPFFPMVAHKSIHVMQAPQCQTDRHGIKRPGSQIDDNSGNRRRLE
jgi:hypothetical protein